MGRVLPENETIKVDVKDKKILTLLAENARRPINDIAKKTKLTRDTVAYRIRRLQEKKIILNFHPNVSYQRFGYMPFHVLLLVEENDKEKQKNLLETITNHKNTISLMEYSDDWDLEWRLIAKNLQEFEDMLMEFLSEFSSIIMERQVFVELETYDSKLLPYDYLKTKTKVVKENKEGYQPDEKDLLIIKELCKDCRMSTYDISKNIKGKLSADAIGLRIKKLVSTGVILGFSIKIRYTNLGYSWYTYVIKMKNFDKKDQLRFKTFVEDHPYIVKSVRTLGPWDLLVYIIADSPSALHSTIKQIKMDFSTQLGSYSTFVAHQEYMHKAVPDVMLE